MIVAMRTVKCLINAMCGNCRNICDVAKVENRKVCFRLSAFLVIREIIKDNPRSNLATCGPSNQSLTR